MITHDPIPTCPVCGAVMLRTLKFDTGPHFVCWDCTVSDDRDPFHEPDNDEKSTLSRLAAILDEETPR